MTITDYKIISKNQVIIKSPSGIEVLKKVKKNTKGYYVNGGYWYYSSRLYLLNYESRLKEVLENE